MRKSGLPFKVIPDMENDLAVSISKTVTTMLRHFDQDERESDGSRTLGFNQISIGEKVSI